MIQLAHVLGRYTQRDHDLRERVALLQPLEHECRELALRHLGGAHHGLLRVARRALLRLQLLREALDVGCFNGFGDTTGLATTFDVFEGFTNVAAVRDTIRQSALDLSRVVQLVRRPDLDLSALGPDARLDRDRIAYLGESFGTVVGTVFAAIEPDVALYVLNVPGGGILDLLLPTSAEIGALALHTLARSVDGGYHLVLRRLLDPAPPSPAPVLAFHQLDPR